MYVLEDTTIRVVNCAKRLEKIFDFEAQQDEEKIAKVSRVKTEGKLLLRKFASY